MGLGVSCGAGVGGKDVGCSQHSIVCKPAKSCLVFQQDNDPTHRAAATIIAKYNKSRGTSISKLAGHPPNSPDLNPIENVWPWVQAEVDSLGCATFEEFQQAVMDKLAAVPKRMCANLVDSMQRRVAKVIKLGGGKTGY